MMILASQSPRRRELLALITPEFRVIPAQGEEFLPEKITPEDAVLLLSRQKAEEVRETLIKSNLPRSDANTHAAESDTLRPDLPVLCKRTFPGCDTVPETIIAADTVVAIDGEILGKPHSREHAAQMLRKLSGREHSVFTGVTVISGAQSVSFAEKTVVEFFPLTEEEIAGYIATGEPMDKAGAYGIQGRGALLVKRIDGDYYNVMGLPVGELHQRLRSMGVC